MVEVSSAGGLLTYSTRADDEEIVAPSRLGIRTDDMELGENVKLGTPRVHKVNEQYPFFGAHRIATNCAIETTIPAQAGGESYFIDVHVANDGVGVRLRLPAKAGRKVRADICTWKLKADPVMWTDKLEAAYESPYHQTSLKQIGAGSLALPLTARIGKMYVTLTEAMVKDYGNLSVKVDKDGALRENSTLTLLDGQRMLP